MSFINIRYTVFATLLAASGYGVYFLNVQFLNNVQNPQLLTGWLLFSLVILLISFNVRKKLSFLPLMSVYIWLQVHIFIGLLALFVFSMHLSFQLPNGKFEIVLATIFIIAEISGLIGLWLSRVLPKFMREHSENVVFERIPALRALLIQQAQTELQKAIDAKSDLVLLHYFTERVLPFLQDSNHSLYYFLAPRKVYLAWNSEFDNLQNLLNQDEIEIAQTVRAIIYKKIGLDFQQSGRTYLRYWLYWHIPLAYVLVMCSLAHLTLVYGFIVNIP